MGSKKQKQEIGRGLYSNLTSVLSIDASGRRINTMAKLEHWSKLLVSLKSKVNAHGKPEFNAEDMKTITKVCKLLVVHSNPSAVWCALADLKNESKDRANIELAKMLDTIE